MQLTKLLASIQGQPLTTDAYLSILNYVATHLQPGLSGIRLEARRDWPGAGFILHIMLIPAPAGTTNTQSGWRMSYKLNANEVLGLSDSSTTWPKTYAVPQPYNQYDPINSDLPKALNLPWQTPITIRNTLKALYDPT